MHTGTNIKTGKKKWIRKSSGRFASRQSFRKDVFQANPEEDIDRSFFDLLGQSAARNAINENKAMGISITYLQGNSIITQQSDGSVRTDRLLPQTSLRRFAKGTVLYVTSKICHRMHFLPVQMAQATTPRSKNTKTHPHLNFYKR